MKVYDTYQDTKYKFYLVDECFNEPSPFGDYTICIPVLDGFRTSCAFKICTDCMLHNRDTICHDLFTAFPPDLQARFPNILNNHPELFV